MKKSLLLSTIMVVVLIASLTVATFAWFFNNQTVTVDQISFAAQTADSLKIKDGYSAEYAYNVKLMDGATYNPATLVGILGDGENHDDAEVEIASNVTSAADVLGFFKKMANDVTSLATEVAYVDADKAKYAAATTSEVWYDEFWLVLETTAVDAEVVIDPTSSISVFGGLNGDSTALLGAIRLAIFEVTGEVGAAYEDDADDTTIGMELVLVWAPNANYTTDAYGNSTYSADPGGDADYANASVQGAVTPVYSTVGNKLGTTTEISLGEFENGVERHFVACVWIEGTDAEAINSNAGLEFVVDLRFSHDVAQVNGDAQTWLVEFDSNLPAADVILVAPASVIVNNAGLVTDPGTLTPGGTNAEEWSLLGWSKDKDAIAADWIFASSTVTSNTKLYAVWGKD